MISKGHKYQIEIELSKLELCTSYPGQKVSVIFKLGNLKGDKVETGTKQKLNGKEANFKETLSLVTVFNFDQKKNAYSDRSADLEVVLKNDKNAATPLGIAHIKNLSDYLNSDSLEKTESMSLIGADKKDTKSKIFFTIRFTQLESLDDEMLEKPEVSMKDRKSKSPMPKNISNTSNLSLDETNDSVTKKQIKQDGIRKSNNSRSKTPVKAEEESKKTPKQDAQKIAKKSEPTKKEESRTKTPPPGEKRKGEITPRGTPSITSKKDDKIGKKNAKPVTPGKKPSQIITSSKENSSISLAEELDERDSIMISFQSQTDNNKAMKDENDLLKQKVLELEKEKEEMRTNHDQNIINSTAKMIKELKDDKEKYKEIMNQLESANKSLQSENERLKGDLENLELEKINMLPSANEESLKSNLEENKKKIVILERSLTNLERDISLKEQKIAQITSERDSFALRIANLEKEILSKDQKFNEINLEKSALLSQVESKNGSIQILEKSVEERDNQFSNLKSDIQKAKKKLEDSDEQRSIWERDLKQRDSQIRFYENEIAIYKNKLEKADSKSELETKYTTEMESWKIKEENLRYETEKMISDKNLEIYELKEHFRKLNEKFEASEKEKNQQFELIKNLETLRDNLKRQLTSKESKIEKLEINISELQSEVVHKKENLAEVMNAVFESGNYELVDKIESLAMKSK